MNIRNVSLVKKTKQESLNDEWIRSWPVKSTAGLVKVIERHPEHESNDLFKEAGLDRCVVGRKTPLKW